MKRREFVEKLGVGSTLLVSGSALATPAHAAQDDDDHRRHDHRPLRGVLSNATVSFGAWPVGSLDRTATPSAPVAPNVHKLIPYVATIKAGGSVNFMIAGFHQIGVYAPGTQPSDISLLNLLPIGPPPAPQPPNVGLISDAVNRVYLGPSPGPLPQDRVEVVSFGAPGLYLVICTVNVHFLDGMYGYVRVRRYSDDD